MTNKGVVTAVNGDTLTVAFERHEACGDCHACMHGSENCAKHMVKIKGKAQVGDVIEVAMDDSHVMEASALAYMLPLAGFIAGLAAGWRISKDGRIWKRRAADGAVRDHRHGGGVFHHARA